VFLKNHQVVGPHLKILNPNLFSFLGTKNAWFMTLYRNVSLETELQVCDYGVYIHLECTTWYSVGGSTSRVLFCKLLNVYKIIFVVPWNKDMFSKLQYIFLKWLKIIILPLLFRWNKCRIHQCILVILWYWNMLKFLKITASQWHITRECLR